MHRSHLCDCPICELIHELLKKLLSSTAWNAGALLCKGAHASCARNETRFEETGQASVH